MTQVKRQQLKLKAKFYFTAVVHKFTHIRVKVSSSGTDVSAPDHLGTREMRERSLRIVGASGDMRCLNLAISALDSSSSARTLISAIFTNKIYSVIKFRILNFD